MFSTRYIDELTKMRCAGDLLSLKLFPNGKEITESFAAFNAARSHLFKRGFAPDDSSVVMAAIGDGVSPRTAATFAFRTRWECHAIDPKMRTGKWHIKVRRGHIQRVRLWASKVEDCVTWEKPEKLVVVAVHSHANLGDAVKVLARNKVGIISIPCCVPQVLSTKEPNIEYQDEGIWSPKNLVKIWFP